jgi:glutaredoxin
MSKSIILVTLEGCSKCSKIRNLLQDNNIKYREVSCSDDSELCDELEKYTKIAVYPMVIVKDTLSNNSIILHSTLDIKAVNKLNTINSNLSTIPAVSTEDTFNNLLKIIR